MGAENKEPRMASANNADPGSLTESPPEAPNGSSGRPLLKERAYAEIKERILRGDFPASTFLSERHIASELDMSKTPVRAALERLELEGFVTISPQQGIIVRDLSVHDIADQYEIRAALETYVVRTVAGRLTPAQVGRLQANLDAQEANCGTGDVQRCVALDAEFHNLFCEFLGNQEILRVMGQLRAKVHRVIARVFTLNAARMASSYREHRAITEAVLRGDAALAARRVEEHLEYGKQCLLSPRGGQPLG
jgi:DNA-binding GntR family transcriptional regulator